MYLNACVGESLYSINRDRLRLEILDEFCEKIYYTLEQRFSTNNAISIDPISL